MSGDEIKETAVGLLALALLALIIVAINMRSTLFAPSSADTYRVTASFNRVDGIGIGTPVHISGIAVGRVEALELTPAFRVRVTLSIDKRIPLPVDSSLSVQTDGLFGPKTLRIEPGGDEETLADGGSIDFTQDPVLVSELLELIIGEGRAARGAAPRPEGG